MKIRNILMVWIAMQIMASTAGAAYYVDAAQPDDSGDGLSWETAKQTIQAAVDLVATNGSVWVTNGTYNIGGAVAPSQSLANRVCIDKAITVQSVNGPEFTVLEGASGSNGSNVDAVRGVYIADGATLSGFTVTNGYTMSAWNDDGDGGGIFMATEGLATNCVLSGNSAFYRGGGSAGYGTLINCTLSGNFASIGGGSYNGTLINCTLIDNSAVNGGGYYGYGTLNNCTLSDNSANEYGGGSRNGTLNNCTLSGNSANSGGGTYKGTLNNCTLSGNSARYYGGGTREGTLNNCTLTGNLAASRGGGTYYGTLNNCIVWGNYAVYYNDIFAANVNYSCASGITPDVNGCITNEPHFANSAMGRFDLLANSPCINAGNNVYASGDTDLAGDPRIVEGTIDMGAYESPDVTNSYLITTIAGENGIIEPANPMVFEGYDQPISILPSLGYYMTSLTVDGIPKTLSESYIFNDVQTTHTIAATFATDPHTLTVENGTGDGSYIVETEVSVVSDPPESGFIFVQWITDPAPFSSGLSDPYSASTIFTMPESNVVLTATYGPIFCYADASRPDDSGDGLSWATAKQMIQAAVDLVEPSGIVWVTNGTYSIGGAVASGQSATNRICIDKAITVQSVNGPEFTIIEGASGSNGGLDFDSVRGVYLADGATLSGFTVTNGYTTSAYYEDGSGGGIFMSGGSIHVLTSGLATNCVLSGNTAYRGGGAAGYGTLSHCTLNGNSASDGGGAYYSTLNHCTLSGNSAGGGGGYYGYGTLNQCTLSGNSAYNGGGVMYGTVNNCILRGNTAYYGGGALNGTLNNCTLVENSANYEGGGTDGCRVNNSIVWGNTAFSYNDIHGANVKYSCASDITAGVNGCITNNPLFVDSANGDFTLQSNSPCINAGHNTYAAGSTDFARDARIAYGVVDMGAYEFSDPISGTADFDQDGIADTWEGNFFGSTSGCDPDGHGDFDPFTNMEEYIAGTDPRNGASLFQIISSAQVVDGFLIEWDAVSNRIYSVYRTGNLTNSFQTLEAGIAYPQSSYIDTNALNNAQGYYRLNVQFQE